MAPSRGCGLLWCLRGPSGTSDSVESRIVHGGKPSGKLATDIYEDAGVNSSTTTLGQDPGHHGMDWQSGGKGGALQPTRRFSSNAVVPFHADDRSLRHHRVSLDQRSSAHAPQELMRELTVESFIDATTMQQTPSGTVNGEPLSGEQLYRSGFKLWHPGNVTLLPGSNVQPLTFLVLDIVRHSPDPHAGTDGRRATGSHARAASDGHGQGQHSFRNRLVPIYTNSCCRAYFKISAHADYVAVVQKLLKRDPLLSFALQKAVRNLRVGDARPVSHVTPDPSGQTSALHGMRLSPCCWRHEGRVLPALMVEHKLPYDPDVIMPRLMRDYAVLSHVPAILTLIDFEGKVLYQNASSLEYMGDLLSTKYDAHVQDGLLQVLFMFDVHSLEAMLEDVLHGCEWQGVVQVPYSLQHLLGQQQDGDTVIDFTRTLAPPSGSPAGTAGAGWSLDDDFRIGGGGRIPRKTAQQSFMTHQPGQPQPLSHRNSGAEGMDDAAPHVRTSPDGTATGAGPGALVERRPSLLDMAPGMQQRKFMSLLEKQQAPSQAVAKRHSEAQAPSPTADAGDGAGAAEGGEGDEEDELDLEPETYHELHAIPLLDPVLDKQVIMLVQTDVTPRVELENKLADLTDAQLSMLEQLFPRHIIEYMLARVPNRVSNNMRELANKHEQVMVLFCDVVGFTSMSKEVEASQVMHFLNELYEAFDGLVDEYCMYKLDIVGDCYIVVAGLIKEDQDGFVCVEELAPEQMARNANNILQFGKAMLRKALSKPVLMPHDSQPVSLRIGIHTGPVVSGLVGSKMPKYTLFGDTMNTASRMESTCRPGCIHVSETFAQLVPEEKWESTGGVQVKGKGLMSTFLWVPEPIPPGSVDDTSSDGTRHLTKSNTMQSSLSGKSRITSRSNSARRRESQTSGDPAMSSGLSQNPLLTILGNIRGDNDSSGHDMSVMGAASSRPKSGRVRGRVREGRSGNVAATVEVAGDWEARRSAATEGGYVPSSSGKTGLDPSLSFRNMAGPSRRLGTRASVGPSRRTSFMELATDSYPAAS